MGQTVTDLAAAALRPLRQRLARMIGRGEVLSTDTTGNVQRHKVRVAGGALLDKVEHAEPYGLTANPPDGADAVPLSVDGDRAQTVIVMVGHRMYRLKGLTKGEVALYDDLDQKVHLKRDGIAIETTLKVTVKAGGKAVIEAAGTVELKGSTGAAVKGLVQGDCVCAFTGAPHAMVSATIKGSA